MKASSLEELRPDLGGLRSSRLGDGSNAVSILAASDPQVVHGGPMVAPNSLALMRSQEYYMYNES